MDPLTLLALGQQGYGLLKDYQSVQEDKRLAGNADARGEAAKLAGDAQYKDLTEAAKYRVQQAPTKAADLQLNLAQQQLDRLRDQGYAGTTSAIAGLKDDPRSQAPTVQRLLNQLNTNVATGENRAAQSAVTAQKIIDDSIYAQQEGERKRLAGLKEKYELLPAMQEYTQQTGLADTLRDRARTSEQQAIQNAIGSTTTLAGMLKEGEGGGSGNDAAEAARRKAEQAFNDYELQNQLAQPIPIDDPAFRQDQMVSRPMDESSLTGIPMSPEDSVEENLDLRTTGQLLNQLDTYEPATAPFGVPTLNAVNRNAVSPDPVTSLLGGVPQSDRDIYRPAPTAVQGLDPIMYTSVTDPLGLEGRSAAYQGSGPQSVYQPLSPLSQQVFGGMLGYNPLGFEAGGKYIGERGGMTEGEFDHDTNKKAIIDEQSGEKEGELTGGEGVFNEDHLAEIVEMIKEGDEDGLMIYLRNLLEEPQFGYEFA